MWARKNSMSHKGSKESKLGYLHLVNLIHNYIFCIMYGYLCAYISARLWNSFGFVEFSRRCLTALKAH